MNLRVTFASHKVGQLEASDLSALHREGELHLGVLADAARCGWSVAYPEASRLLLQSFWECWQKSARPSIPLPHRLRCAVRGSARHFLRWLGPDPQDPDSIGLPSGSLLAVALSPGEGSLACAWVGCHEVHLLDEHSLLAENLQPRRPGLLQRQGKERAQIFNGIHPGEPVRVYSRLWRLPSRGRLFLSNQGWPNLLTLNQLELLSGMTNRRSGRAWCKAHSQPFFCVISAQWPEPPSTVRMMKWMKHALAWT